jgi:hypothetical protein
MDDSEFTPIENIKSVFSHWWILVGFAVVGGVIGWLFHFLQPPIYEATARITVSMDFSERELTQYEQDYAFSSAGEIIISSTLKDQILAKALATGISISSTQLRQQMFSEGRQSVWELHIRNPDAQVATDLANIWAGVAVEDLNIALDHAMQAEQLQYQVDVMEACLPFPPGMPGPDAKPHPTLKDCGRFSLADIRTALANRTDELVQQRKLSLGVLPNMAFGLTGNASIPAEPVLYDQAVLTLAGTLIGFIIALWVTGSRGGKHRD